MGETSFHPNRNVNAVITVTLFDLRQTQCKQLRFCVSPSSTTAIKALKEIRGKENKLISL